MRLAITLVAAAMILAAGSMEGGGRLPALSYRGGGQGKVVFDHQRHASQGFRCNDCHTDFAGTGKPLFATRKQALISSADHTSGAKCFACHNGKAAFHHCGLCHYQTGVFQEKR